MTPFGPIPGMPGGPPPGSVEAIQALSWYQNQQAAAAYASQLAAQMPPLPPPPPLTAEQQAQQQREFAERERLRKERQAREEAERRAHDTRVQERELLVGWPAAQVRLREIEGQLWRYVGFPQTFRAPGAVAWLLFWVAGGVAAAIATQQAGALCVALPGALALGTIRRWRKTMRGQALRDEIARLRTLRGCGERGCAICRG